MSIFSEQVDRANTLFSYLPLFHTCDGFDARKHFQMRELQTEDICEVFDEKITYLFYGRPAFKYEVTDQSTKQLQLYPVCFVFDLYFIKDIKRIYPFDSGAMHHKLLSDFVGSKMTLADFELEPDRKRIADVVLRFYETNSAYLESKFKGRPIDPLNFESVAYQQMNDAYLANTADERRVTIEVQAGQTVPFSGGALKAVIAPTQYLSSPLFQSFVSELKIDVRTYEINVWNPRMSFGLLADLSKQYLREKEYDV
ncbi:hypothetical protein ACWGNA_13390 [Brucella cytisi]|uniref:hypothetical protein n=1 Tax=Brucella cytisi TaxID=407152 RepID=UPI0035E22FDD